MFKSINILSTNEIHQGEDSKEPIDSQNQSALFILNNYQNVIINILPGRSHRSV